MNLNELNINSHSFRLIAGDTAIEFVKTEDNLPADFANAKSATFPVRLTIPNTPFLIPEQELDVQVAGELSRAKLRPKDLWPIISFNIVTETSGETLFKWFAIAPAGNSVAGYLLFSRFVYYLSQAQQLVIQFPSIQKEFAISFTLTEDLWQQVLYCAAMARKLRFLENFFGKNFQLSNQFSTSDISVVDMLFRGIIEGEFVVHSSTVSSRWDAPLQSELNRPPFTGVGQFTTSFNSEKVELFNQQLKIGRVVMEINNAEMVTPTAIEQIRERPNRPVEMQFLAQDQRVLIRFEKYLQELSRNKKLIAQKLDSFKDSLLKKYSEPEQLVNLLHLPLLDESSEPVLPQLPGFIRQATAQKSAIEALSPITTLAIDIPDANAIAKKLAKHQDVIAPLVTLCHAVRQIFEPDIAINLDLHRDAENGDEYFALILRPQNIDLELFNKVDDLSGQYGPDVADLSSWLLINFDLGYGEQASSWTDYLAFAKQLHHHQQPDPYAGATIRSIVSRSYFAALSHWRYRLREQPDVTLSGNAFDHILIRDYLRRNDRAALALQFDRLRQWREIADYQDSFISIDLIADLAIRMAESIMELR